MFHPVDVQGEVLAAGGDDLVVEQGVAVDVGEVRGDQVVPVEGRQNADHRNRGVHLPGFPVGICQRCRQFLGEAVEYPAAQPVRSDVDFQVEHREFRLEVPARDALQYLRIQHFRHPVGADQIQFDLQPHEVLGAVEPLLLQQPLQPLQAPPELVAVAVAIGQVELACHDLLPHRSVLPRSGGPDAPAAWVLVRWDDAPPTRSITSRRGPAPTTLDFCVRRHIHAAWNTRLFRVPRRSREKRRRQRAVHRIGITRGHRGAVHREPG